jgi:hypothetical protein
VRKIGIVVVLVALVGVVGFADNNVREKRVNIPIVGGGTSEGGETLYTLDYFFAGPAGTYTWNGTFYMSNMFKPDPLWYPFGIMTVEVNPARLGGLTTTGVAGTIAGVRIFTGAGPTVNVAASRLALTGAAVGTWYPVNFTAATAVVIGSGNFWAGLWNSTGVEGGLQGEATGWVAPPVEPFECINSGGATPSAGGAGPWSLHATGDCGDQYGTTSAATVRVTVDDTVPVELMRFSVE